MACWSRLHPEIEALSCRAVAHPWTDNCLLAAGRTWIDCCIGSSGFFALLYLCQFVSTALKKKKKGKLKDFLRMHVRSTVFGATLSTTTFSAHCIIRRLLGKYTFPTMVFIPAFIGGQSIYLESRKGRELYTNAFANCCLELWQKLLEKSKIFKWNPNVQTILFMVLSSLLSSSISWTNFDLNYYWFFLPPKAIEPVTQDEICFHKGNCRNHIINLFLVYSSTGLVVQFLRQFFSNLKNPKFFLTSLTSPKNFKLAAFLGGYAVFYQAIRCFLYQREGKYSVIHDSLAGFLAGVAFRFQPTIPIFNSAVITVAQIFTEIGYRKKILPNFRYLETIFALSCALLFHYRILSEYSPSLMVYFMSGVTHGLSDRIANKYRKIISSLTENS